MPLEPAPTLEQAAADLPEAEQKPSSGKNWTRWTLIFLTMILLAANLFWKSDATSALRGRGAVSGIVTNQAGRPLTGEALILSSGQRVPLAADGSFLLESVPAGNQSLIILDAYSGYEVKVNVIAGKTVNVGAIQFQVTAEPGG
ncbi:MAG: hypothetical protein OHK0031_00410 [Anaerolineales bacterium]